MPAIRTPTSEEENWIRDLYPAITPKDVSVRLECHVHTAIRILVRLGLMNPPADKYQPGSGAMRKTTERDCLVCHKHKRLDKNQFICNSCRSRQRDQGML
mgnify:CR=1 FL=1